MADLGRHRQEAISRVVPLEVLEGHPRGGGVWHDPSGCQVGSCMIIILCDLIAGSLQLVMVIRCKST